MAYGRHWALATGVVLICACGSTHPAPAPGAAAAGHDHGASAGNAALDDVAGGGTAAGGGSAGTSTGRAGATNAAGGGGGLQLDIGDGVENAGAAGAAGPSLCDLGDVTSTGTNQNLDLFGAIVYFADGNELPAGRYRISYVDGCMKYSAAQGWSLHAYAGAEPDGWWFVGNDSTQKIIVPPGTVGFLVGSGGFSTFEECVAANLALPPLEFDFAGGKLGAWLQDSPYTDNLAGEGDRNPKWKLTLLADCERVPFLK